eukprot:12099207-Alexandrium_andersonii.AAC.1
MLLGSVDRFGSIRIPMHCGSLLSNWASGPFQGLVFARVRETPIATPSMQAPASSLGGGSARPAPLPSARPPALSVAAVGFSSPTGLGLL